MSAPNFLYLRKFSPNLLRLHIAPTLAAVLFFGSLAPLPLVAQTLTLASTTSTEQSGLFAYLLPKFTQQTSISVRVVAVGTGQAIDIARRGDADILLVHDRLAEEKFVADGFALQRNDVMFNDFVLIGPKSDAASFSGKDIAAALAQVLYSNRPFISRGDRSGTHSAELKLWALSQSDKKPGFSQYKECGCSMGAALNIASALGAYVLSDRATWAAFKNRGDLQIVVQGQEALKNQYGVLLVNPEKYPHVQYNAAKKLADWLLSKDGQDAIAHFKIDGQAVFFPNASTDSIKPARRTDASTIKP